MKRKSLYTLLLAGTTALVPSQALAMPGAIAALVLPLVTSSPIFFLGPAAISAVSLGIGYAAAAGALFLARSALAPDQPSTPKPEDGRLNFRQPVPSLSYVLGRVRKGGDYVFFEETGGAAYHIMVMAGHRINAFTEHWFHDEALTLDGSGWVTAPAHFVASGAQKQRILTRLGVNAETAYSDVVTAFSSIWTNDHRGDGLASVRMSAATVSQQDYLKVYPQQMPQHTAVMEGALLYDPREAGHDKDDPTTWEFSTNLALMRMWHLTHPVGGKLSIDDLHLDDWINAANVCDKQVTNRDGGSENSYHGGFWFRANNDPVEVGRIIDQAAELIVYERADGKVGVHAGEYVAPDIRLTKDDIVAVSFDTNRRKSSNVVAVRGKYTDPTDNKYVTKDAAPYGDPYSEDQERTRTIDNQAVQSHNHMARLEKIAYTRANAPRVSIVAHWHAAKNVPYRRFVKVHVPPRLDEAIIELTGRPKRNLRNLTVEFQGIVVPSTLYDFNAATEEGAPGAVVSPVVPGGVPDPVNFNVTIQTETVSGGGTAAYALATWDHVSDALVYELEWELNAGGTKQSVMSVAGEDQVRSGYLADGSEFKFRLRAWSGGGASEWTSYQVLTATADPNAPDPATGVSGSSPSAGEFRFDWTAPNSANYYGARLYLNTANDFATATLQDTEYGYANDVESRTFTGLAANTYYGWVVAINASGVAASEVATGSVVVS